MDGTFKSCPRKYGTKGQLYTIHGVFQDQDEDGRTRSESFPLIYALLPNKSKSVYIELFKQI